MTLKEITKLIYDELYKRNLAQPGRRKNAFAAVSKFIESPESGYDSSNIVLSVDKKTFKDDYRRYKGCDLSGAEESVINEMYNQYNKHKYKEERNE